MTTDSKLVIFEADSDTVVFEADNALKVFACESPEESFAPILAPIKKAVEDFTLTASAQTKDGRDEIKRFAMKVVKSKTALESIGKALADEIKRQPKMIDASRRYLEKTLDDWRDQVREPVTKWETAEKARVEKHESAVLGIKALTTVVDQSGQHLSANQLRASIEIVDAIAVSEAACEEYLDAYRSAKDAALALLRPALEARVKYEAEQEELEKLRAEKAARDARDAEIAAEEARQEREAQIATEAMAQAEAAARAEQERIAAAAAQREADLQRQIETERAEKEAAEKRALEAAETAKREAEEEAARKARIEAEAQRLREADVAHKRKINTAAVQAFVDNGLTEEAARNVVTLIAKGLIPSITINY